MHTVFYSATQRVDFEYGVLSAAYTGYTCLIQALI